MGDCHEALKNDTFQHIEILIGRKKLLGSQVMRSKTKLTDKVESLWLHDESKVKNNFLLGFNEGL